MSIMVISKSGERLMPTVHNGKVRRLLREGKAKIVGRHPFTVQLLYDTTNYTQPIELCVDTGYQHIGLSLKSESREYVSEQYDLLPQEKERHDDCRKFRRTRRNRRRYRKCRFNNRKASKKKGWIAPSLQNKADCHVDRVKKLCSVAPVTVVYLEMGQFDTQLLQAIEEGKPIPEGVDYQHGDRYGSETLRQAVFQRDRYTCVFCSRNAFRDSAKLHEHHAYYWRGQHGNRLSELATACELCHTPKNHQPGGKLWGFDKKLPRYTGAAFMNTVKWYIYECLKAVAEDVYITYGAKTKIARDELNLEKSHVNDAYAMGLFHPEDRAETAYYKKRRRNNRCLERFYDAKYIDIRDGRKKSGAELSCGRINRREPRNGPKNERIFHGEKVSKGRRSIRTVRYTIQPGDALVCNGKTGVSAGCFNHGTWVRLKDGTSVAVSKVKILRHAGGWLRPN